MGDSDTDTDEVLCLDSDGEYRPVPKVKHTRSFKNHGLQRHRHRPLKVQDDAVIVVHGSDSESEPEQRRKASPSKTVSSLNSVTRPRINLPITRNALRPCPASVAIAADEQPRPQPHYRKHNQPATSASKETLSNQHKRKKRRKSKKSRDSIASEIYQIDLHPFENGASSESHDLLPTTGKRSFQEAHFRPQSLESLQSNTNNESVIIIDEDQSTIPHPHSKRPIIKLPHPNSRVNSCNRKRNNYNPPTINANPLSFKPFPPNQPPKPTSVSPTAYSTLKQNLITDWNTWNPDTPTRNTQLPHSIPVSFSRTVYDRVIGAYKGRRERRESVKLGGVIKFIVYAWENVRKDLSERLSDSDDFVGGVLGVETLGARCAIAVEVLVGWIREGLVVDVGEGVDGRIFGLLPSLQIKDHNIL
ncbi:hypothetical protein BCR33DRAFT_714051 [Rhizoclosmatium globosum]|uniref:Uncharacterized protein n=1 Tax=Rhizoclosmatium globosum TaxID=329046 RepID=A0A1Y2CPU7_9FUNG|nr:hypothetical protein BCR33DRAFT_714051 [Rhizoclosmatium globosum]|eukprot:ORY48956.1 hypothetical protein BCR33DRAFT_714051 [Rhizoclosmatium globosum]